MLPGSRWLEPAALLLNLNCNPNTEVTMYESKLCKPRTIKQLAQDAIDVQSACNLSGVVHAFSRLITELRGLLEKDPGFSTESLNQHPIVQAYADKLASLARIQNDIDASMRAHGACNALAAAPDPAPDPHALPEVAINSVRARYPKEADEILPTVRYDCCNGCWFFERWGMYVGIEKDGYIHT